ncbi:queuine/archaeosine tRNA-ribosyltransferase [Pedobacter sp. CG_S7]|uniref:hypothetical protein n=1 Tax=Pedobacter sp. CG_S7 TaxID=3143930 RepID=UPI003397BB24
MIDSNKTFTLIEGKFDPTAATTLISTLFGTKIEYHNRNILRAQEWDGSQLPHEVDRVNELSNSREAFQEKMKEALKQGCQVEISSVISVRFIKEGI